MASRKTPPPAPEPTGQPKPRNRKRPTGDAVPTLTRVQVRNLEDRRRKQAAFLAEFSKRGLVASSAKAAGIHRDTVYEWRKSDPEFAAEYDEVDALVTEVAEAELWRRGIEGWDEPLAHNGVLTGETVRRWDASLLTLVLKARAPEKYRERLDLRHSGPGEPTAADRLVQALLADPSKAAEAEAFLDSLG
jgi:hypothetical protein